MVFQMLLHFAGIRRRRPILTVDQKQACGDGNDEEDNHQPNGDRHINLIFHCKVLLNGAKPPASDLLPEGQQAQPASNDESAMRSLLAIPVRSELIRMAIKRI